MFDEYGEDDKAALRAIDDGAAALGEDVILSLARAKILWRRSDHSEVVSILRDVEKQIDRNEPIGRAFALREAAISAANTADLIQAEKWFGEAASAAASSPSDAMRPMAIGLKFDASIASFNAGRHLSALHGFSAGLEALRTLDPDGPLKAAYCHRVARHAVLWLKAQVDDRVPLVDGEPIVMLPGACSNPEPLDAIRELPLGHLDVAFYMMAEIEIIVGEDAAIARELTRMLEDGPIPAMELMLRKAWIDAAIKRLDTPLFANRLVGWLEAKELLRRRHSEHRLTFDVMSPPRGNIPKLSSLELQAENSQVAALDTIISFCINAVLCNKAALIESLEAKLIDEIGKGFPGSAIFALWREDTVSLNPLDNVAARAVGLLRDDPQIDPANVWGIGLRLFEKIDQSEFKEELTPVLAGWLRVRWNSIIANERFYLTNPMTTVPSVEAVLDTEHDDRSFVAALLLAAADAVGARLSSTYRTKLDSVLSDKTNGD